MPTGASSHIQDVLGRGVLTKIYAKEPILEARLTPKRAGGGFPANIPRDMWAVAVAVNEVVGVAVAGMHVDVIISGTPPSGTGVLGTQTRTLLANIEVLAAGQDFKKDAEGKLRNPLDRPARLIPVAPAVAEFFLLARARKGPYCAKLHHHNDKRCIFRRSGTNPTAPVT